MTKYVVPVADPPAGQDWSTTVPGIYLWDVIGITAQIATSGVTATLVDSSGHGFDGTYESNFPFGAFVPGLIAGDDAWQPAAPPGTPAYDGASIPFGLADFTDNFTIAYWQRYDPAELGGGTFWLSTFDAADDSVFQIIGSAGDGSPGTQPIIFDAAPGPVWVSPGDAIAADGVAHLIAFVWDTVNLTLYVDGVSVPWDTFVPGIPRGPATSSRLGNNGVGAGTFDELTVFNYAVGQPALAALYTAGLVDIEAYAMQVRATGPYAYYHLDGASPGPGRQVDLIATDGTHTVLEIPTGFGPPGPLSPYGYSWQPAASASTVSNDGTLTTVAIPALFLPAGYTVGTSTIDIAPTDQWQNISLWWDDSVQQVQDNLDPYAYAGAHLLYHQQGT